jgi:hypothetical protein
VVVQWVDNVEWPKVSSLGLDYCIFLTFLDVQVGGRQEARTKKRYSQVQARHTVLFRVSVCFDESPDVRHIFYNVSLPLKLWYVGVLLTFLRTVALDPGFTPLLHLWSKW